MTPPLQEAPPVPRRPRPGPAARRALVIITDDLSCAMAIEALEADAERRRAAVVVLAGELAQQRAAGQDIRTAALTVVDALAEADALLGIAGVIRDARQLAEDADMDNPEALEEQLAALAAPGLDLPLPGGRDPDIAAARQLLGLVPPLEDDDDLDPDELGAAALAAILAGEADPDIPGLTAPVIPGTAD